MTIGDPAASEQSQDEPEVVYHYTTTQGLLGIVENHEFFATDVLYMNDSQEADYRAKQVDVVLAELMYENNQDAQRQGFLNQLTAWGSVRSVSRDFSPVFATCFSQDDDLLAQWRAYGRNGFAIGFARSELANAERQFVKVIYEPTKQQETIRSVVGEAMNAFVNTAGEQAVRDLAGETRDALFWAASSFKNQAFSDEQEWRLIQRSRPTGDHHFRETNMGLTPYMKFGFAGGNFGALSRPESPIRRVVVGPTAHTEHIVRAVILLLVKSGIWNRPVDPSEVPWRVS